MRTLLLSSCFRKSFSSLAFYPSKFASFLLSFNVKPFAITIYAQVLSKFIFKRVKTAAN